MNQIVLTLVIILLLITQSRSESQMESINTARKLLSLASSLPEKAKGLALAKQYDEPSVNDALVAMLDDETPGGRLSNDEGIEMPWIESMHLLANRFPEVGIKINIDYRYTQQEKTTFLRWWSENRTRIEYRGNTHILKDGKKAAPSASESSEPPTTKNLPNTQNSTVSERESLPVVPPAPKNAPSSAPAPTPSEEPTSSTQWSIIVVLIFAAGGLLWLLLKGRK